MATEPTQTITGSVPPEPEATHTEAATVQPQTAQTAPQSGVQAKRILIVEDEKPLSHALEMKLKNQGYDTHVVMNGADALTEVQRSDYDMILLDLIMPVMDGFAVLQELHDKKIKVPVIVLSNLGQDEDRAKTKELGAIDYFVKSNTPISEIVARVKSALA